MAHAVNNRFEFDRQKAIEAITYVAGKLNESTFFFISKVLYYADLDHLEKYSCPVLGDNYIAMKNGPVPGKVYNIMKNAHLDSDAGKAFNVSGYNVSPVRTSNLDYLSQSDIDSLDAGVIKVTGKTFDQLSQESHDAAWHAADQNNTIPLDSMLNMLTNSAAIKDYIAVPD